MRNKKIVVFSGAGLDRESNVLTFRDTIDGLWENHSIDEVATPEGWKKDPEKVLNFYNERRQQMPTVEPNDAHKVITQMESEFSSVINITQNVSDLLERGGASEVYHLHGELSKARGTKPVDRMKYILGEETNEIIDINYNDINIGDKCPEGTQLRPHIVWFGEMPYYINKSNNAIDNCDVLIIVGTSLNIGYTLPMLARAKKSVKVFYVDPEPSMDLTTDYKMGIEYIEEPATVGMAIVMEKLLEMYPEEEEIKNDENV